MFCISYTLTSNSLCLIIYYDLNVFEILALAPTITEEILENENPGPFSAFNSILNSELTEIEGICEIVS